MEGGQGGPVGSAYLGCNQIPPIYLNAQGGRMANVTEKQLGGLLQCHATIGHLVLRSFVMSETVTDAVA